jgi:hypothetical protein
MKIYFFWLFLGLWLNSNLVFAQDEDNCKVQDIFFETNVTPETGYVNTQFIYTIRLYYHSCLSPRSMPKLSKFNIEHTDVEKLDTKFFDEIRKNETYKVEEHSYSIFPEKNGQLIIPSISINGIFTECPEYYCSTKSITLNPKSITIDVKPKPKQFKNEWLWLPAQNFTLEEKWIFKHPFFQVGKPVTRILTLQAKGLKEKQLSKIYLPTLAEINSYLPENSKSQPNKYENTGIVNSQFQQKFILEPTKAGNFILPKIEIPWWDIKKQQLSYAILPAQTIYVRPLTQKTSKIFENMWFWFSVSLNLVLMLFGWWYYIKYSNTKKVKQKSELLPNNTIKKAHKNLKLACEKNNPKQAQQALLEWVKIVYQTDNNIQNLGNIAKISNNMELQVALNELERVLYSDKKIEWNGKRFWKVIVKNMDNTSNGKKVFTSSPLPQLY